MVSGPFVQPALSVQDRPLQLAVRHHGQLFETGHPGPPGAQHRELVELVGGGADVTRQRIKVIPSPWRLGQLVKIGGGTIDDIDLSGTLGRSVNAHAELVAVDPVGSALEVAGMFQCG
jgi:hypothetical protein